MRINRVHDMMELDCLLGEGGIGLNVHGIDPRPLASETGEKVVAHITVDLEKGEVVKWEPVARGAD